MTAITLVTAGDGNHSTVPCQVGTGGDRQPPTPGSSLKGAFLAALDQRGAARLTMLFSAACTVTLPPSSSSLPPSASASVRGSALVPCSPLALTPLYAKRLCDVPLAASLCGPSPPGAAPSNGLLTMDAARSLLPLAAADPEVYGTPLVGVWVKGAAGVRHPAVYAACLRYAYCPGLPDRAAQDEGGAFLLLLCPGGECPSWES